MKYAHIITTFLLLTSSLILLNAQVAINTDNSNPDASAMLDVKSTDKGVLIPRMTTAQRTMINSPATGLLVFDTETAGFWFYNGTAWQDLSATPNQIADADGDTKIQVEESADEDNIRFDVAGTEAMTINNNGQIGIGADLFPYRLNVQKSENNITTIGVRNRYGGNNIAPDASGAQLLFSGYRDVDANWSIASVLGKKVNGDRPDQLVNGGELHFYTRTGYFPYDNTTFQPRMVIKQFGEVGIGTSTPDSKLHVVGNIKMVDGNQAVGNILTSDANGLSTWTNPNDGLPVPDTASLIPIRYHGSYIYVHPTDNAMDTDWTGAQDSCSNLVAFGFDDWYLPSKLELDAMYKQSYLITGLSQTTSAKYWSATEQDASNAFTQRLDYGGPDPDVKTDTTGHNCRCVRRN